MDFVLFIGLGNLVHAVFFASIFDIYYKTPLVHGMKDQVPDYNAPAERLVLFVGDGLRADKLYELDENGRTRAPYLRNVIEKEGSWGISHTQPPTESRPAHVAMTAGFFEDPSAIYSGFSDNPVKYDSVFNKSRTTWSWGSYDVLPIILDGLHHVHINIHPNSVLWMSQNDYSKLDEWVVEKVAKFLEDGKTNVTLRKSLMQNKIIFFVHLVGIDTQGHRYNPDSVQYLSNIKVVDKGIHKMVGLFEDFYSHDKKTSYVFTSDHGMAAKGGHGGTSWNETQSPFIAWGAGLTKHHLKSNIPSSEVKRTRSWKLDPETRHDVRQIDIPPLLSSLIGLPVPVNSLGTLPVPHLALGEAKKSKMLLANARQLAELFLTKKKVVEGNAVLYIPFWSLNEGIIADRVRDIMDQNIAKEYQLAIKRSYNLIELSQAGFHYYNTYCSNLLLLSITLGFVGWALLTLDRMLLEIGYIKRQVCKIDPFQSRQSNRHVLLGFLFLTTCLALNLFLSHADATSYLYCVLVASIWYLVVMRRTTFYVAICSLKQNEVILRKVVGYIAIGMIGVWSLVLSFSYRYVLSIHLVAVAVHFIAHYRSQLRISAAALCLFLSVFTLLPTVERESSLWSVTVAGILGSAFALQAANKIKFKPLLALSAFPFFTQLLIRLCASNRWNAPSYAYVFAWTLLICAWIVPLLLTTRLLPRLICILTLHCSVFLCMCLSYDGLFLVVLCALLVLWIALEREASTAGSASGRSRSGDLVDFDFAQPELAFDYPTTISEPSFHTARRCYLFLFFTVLAFFGVSDIMSLKSYNYDVFLLFTRSAQLRRTVFLAYKVIMPYILLGFAFSAVQMVTGSKFQHLVCTVMIIAEFINVHFLFMIKTAAPWTDIGTSIGNYIVSITLLATVLDFIPLATFLLRFRFKSNVLRLAAN